MVEKREFVEREKRDKKIKTGSGKRKETKSEIERETQTGKGVICYLVPDKV